MGKSGARFEETVRQIWTTDAITLADSCCQVQQQIIDAETSRMERPLRDHGGPCLSDFDLMSPFQGYEEAANEFGTET